MAPPPSDIPEDEEQFLDDVEAFYHERGVPWERHPKVGGRNVPLLKLYKLVMEHGGYDQLSAERMQWRSLTKHFGFHGQQEAANTFQLKTTYYKNLAAYEIAKHWHEDPPPPEILESLTAKGGDLRSRTLENYPAPGSREAGSLVDGTESAEDRPATPKRETIEQDEPGSGGRYPTRQLRQDPKRTQLFQPDLSSTRQLRYPRTTSSPQPSPVPTHTYNNASADPRNPSFSLDRYEPRQPIALSLRPVTTPGNNPEIFWQQKAAAKLQSLPKLPADPNRFLRSIIPNNMSGPNIYLRCLYGLRSGIPDEQDFALHHLVKVSYERGDKYKFEGFPLLAESLLEKALEISQLVYGFTWEISYDTVERPQDANTLNAAFGTSGLWERLKMLEPRDFMTGPSSSSNSQKLGKLNEAALVIRNMTILEENAVFISKFPLFRDFLLIALNLPQIRELFEYRHYALEMAEQVTRYWDMAPDDPLYLTLLDLLDADDRGSIICSLHAICRIGMETQNIHTIAHVKPSTVSRLIAFTLLDEDDELLLASLDFLYQFTASTENVSFMLKSNSQFFTEAIPRLVKLLLHNAISNKERILAKQPQTPPPNQAIPNIPPFIFEQLIQLPEPERSSRWLRCCFEESPQADITQIAIWQAYHGRFQHHNAMPAAEFIKNVSNTFATAQAQVINGQPPKFIIKGIRPRRILHDLTGRPLIKCQWETSKPELFDVSSRLAGRHLCNQWQTSREELWSHILKDHMQISRQENGSFRVDTKGNYICRWSGCTRLAPLNTAREAGKHVKIHIPESAEAAARLAEELGVKEAEYAEHLVYYTPVDEKNHPCGIPFMSIMVLRNLARFANRNAQQFERKGDSGRVTLMDQLFGHVKPSLWHALTVNRTLAPYLSDLMKMIERGEGSEVGRKREVAVNGTGDAISE